MKTSNTKQRTFKIFLWAVNIIAASIAQIIIQSLFEEKTKIMYQLFFYLSIIMLIIGALAIIFLLVKWKFEDYLDKKFAPIVNDIVVFKLRQLYNDKINDPNRKATIAFNNGITRNVYGIEYVNYVERVKIKEDLIAHFNITDSHAEEIINNFFSISNEYK